MNQTVVFDGTEFKSIDNCRDITLTKGTLRRVFELLKINLKDNKGTTKKMLMEVGGTEASKRARDIRLGFYTPNTRKRGEVLWVRYDSKTEFYWLEVIKWEVWVQRHQAAQRPDSPKLIDTANLRAINH